MEAIDEIDLDAELRARGYRVTQPRRAVWEALRTAAGHVTVEHITARTAELGYEVDLASVYRSLDLLEELGLARASRLGESEAGRWELAHPDEHFHLVCVGCGEVEHHVGSLVAQIRDHVGGAHGFAVEGVELTVTGWCARCRRDRRDRGTT